jgi:hypothetical protein
MFYAAAAFNPRAGLGALHRTLIFHMLLALVHRMGMIAFKGSKHLHSGQ